jgi:acyl-lipid omega-6 desaturase (Delta-12 desaturase)
MLNSRVALQQRATARYLQVIVSWISCATFAAIAFPVIVSNFGWFGIVKYWLGPWLGYHFWMSTFTIVHHTAPHIPFKGGREWNAAKSQLSGTVHCNYPAWVEFLCHDISWHVPHHVASNIPWCVAILVSSPPVACGCQCVTTAIEH